MPYPSHTYPNFAALEAAINELWVTNGVGDITGDIGNSIVNGLLTFIEQSPLNWQKADVISGGGDVVLSRPVSIIITTTPTSLAWVDNIYNQQVIINTRTDDIPLANGFSFYNIDLTVQTSIAAKQTVVIYKAKNGLWLQGNNSTVAPISPVIDFELNFIVGDGNPNGMVQGQTTLVINTTNALINNSVKIFLDGTRMYPSATDQSTYSIVYTNSSATITFNMDGLGSGVSNGQKFIIDYETVS